MASSSVLSKLKQKDKLVELWPEWHEVTFRDKKDKSEVSMTEIMEKIGENSICLGRK